MKTLGITTEFADLGSETLPCGKKIPLPPVLLGHLGDDPAKKTLLVYGHLDVQPAAKVSESFHFLGFFFNKNLCHLKPLNRISPVSPAEG